MKEIRIIQALTKYPLGYHVLVLIISALRTVGLYWYNKENALSSEFALAIMCLRIIIMYLVIMLIILPVLGKLLGYLHPVFSKFKLKKAHSIGYNMVLLLIIWLPSLLIKYPGALCYDTWYMIYQYRTGAITAQHSVFYTILIGKLMDLCYNEKIALFVFVALHTLLLAFAFAYALRIIDCCTNNRLIRYGTLLFCSLNPYLLGYIGVAIKDIPYAAAMVIITAMMIELAKNGESFEKDYRKEFFFYISILFCALIRINGIYTVIVIACVLLVKMLKGHRYFITTAVVIIAIFSFVVINTTLNNHYSVIPSGTEHMLSVPLQQTARYVKYHEKDINEEEKAVINSVMEYNKISNSYDPRIADPLKAIYKKNNGNEKSFLLVWAKLFFRHPLCYLSAFTEMYYYIISPEASTSNIVLYQDDDVGYEIWMTYIISDRTPFYSPIFKSPERLEPLKKWAVNYYRGLHNNWFIGTVSNLSLCVYVFLILLGKLILDRKPFILAFLPGLISLLFVLVGPAIYGHPRYLFPIEYSIPLIIGYAYSQYQQPENAS